MNMTIHIVFICYIEFCIFIKYRYKDTYFLKKKAEKFGRKKEKV